MYQPPCSSSPCETWTRHLFRGWWNGKGKLRPPRFKRRSNDQSIRICGKGFRTADKGVRFPKIGELRLRWSRHLPAPPTSVTIIKDCRDRYFASFVVEVEGQPLPASSKAVGIDLGLTSLAVTSDGETIQPPKFLRSALRRIRRLSRDLSRKEKGPATAPRPASDWPRLTPR
ncbi:MAG: transposase [Synechococcus sp. SB0662_bin_45]|nr:transposase [Synechococcus sp. SB0668_bin_13]MYE21823.1 transposase [Synechococcus sp. SB0662_bin_45]